MKPETAELEKTAFTSEHRTFAEKEGYDLVWSPYEKGWWISTPRDPGRAQAGAHGSSGNTSSDGTYPPTSEGETLMFDYFVKPILGMIALCAFSLLIVPSLGPLGPILIFALLCALAGKA